MAGSTAFQISSSILPSIVTGSAVLREFIVYTFGGAANCASAITLENSNI
ncbi:MAG: hypothetical protein M0D57_15800 [Sphingobacteriales bacterium JAD_PAG50586_3]|nr:MAG: hypothetical protein M0D57_15800 [Sphingobacteriales bacterium JAD_PAG50586_3]